MKIILVYNKNTHNNQLFNLLWFHSGYSSTQHNSVSEIDIQQIPILAVNVNVIYQNRFLMAGHLTCAVYRLLLLRRSNTWEVAIDNNLFASRLLYCCVALVRTVPLKQLMFVYNSLALYNVVYKSCIIFLSYISVYLHRSIQSGSNQDGTKTHPPAC